MTGPFGHELTYAYTSGILSSVTTPDGAITYTVDADENLTRVTYPDTSERDYVYEDTDFPHHLTGIIDENGIRSGTGSTRPSSPRRWPRTRTRST